MSQHTPGPWTISEYPLGDGFIIGAPGKPSGTHVASVTSGKGDRANAHLIAAAPKMLEALKAALERMESDWQVIEGEFGPGYGAAKKRKMCDIDAAIAAKEPTVEEIIAVRAAIAEAEGRS